MKLDEIFTKKKQLEWTLMLDIADPTIKRLYLVANLWLPFVKEKASLEKLI